MLHYTDTEALAAKRKRASVLNNAAIIAMLTVSVILGLVIGNSLPIL